MSTFALGGPPAILTVDLQRLLQCSPTAQLKTELVASVPYFSPVTFSAQVRLTSELLRFL